MTRFANQDLERILLPSGSRGLHCEFEGIGRLLAFLAVFRRPVSGSSYRGSHTGTGAGAAMHRPANPFSHSSVSLLAHGVSSISDDVFRSG